MHPRTFSLAALIGLAALASSPRVAASAPAPIQPQKLCLKPSIELCAATPTTSVCGEQHLEHCKALLGAAWQNNPARKGAEVRRMLRPNLEPDMPQNLRSDGRFYPFRPNPKGLVTRSRAAGTPVFGPLARNGPIPTAREAKPGHRNPAWQGNGAKVASCEEFAYESIYDWGRFVDSVALCDGDADCAMDVAYMTKTPGIMSRTLRRRDGLALAPQPMFARRVLPKNVMYSIGADWVYVNGTKPLAPTPELKAMEADLRKGAEYRAIDCSTHECKTAEESYASEYDYHLAMRKKLAHVSVEEREELARRRAEFERLYAAWARAAGEQKRKIDEKVDKLSPQGKAPWLEPGEPLPWQALLDPWVRVDAVRHFERALVRAQPGTVDPRGRPANQWPGLKAIPSPAPDWGLAFLAPTPAPRLPDGQKFDPLQGQPPLLECGEVDAGSLFKRDILACRLAAFMREEWRRKQRGQLSCLDPDRVECDWSPEMFRDRALALGERYLNQQQALYDQCVGITRNGVLPEQDLDAVPDYFRDMGEKIGKSLAALDPYRLTPAKSGDGGLRFGTSSPGGDSWGDTALFEAGHEYQLSWALEPNGYQEIPAQPDKGIPASKLACQFEADANATINTHVHIFGHKIPLLDAGMQGAANRAKSGRVTLNTSIKLLGVQLLSRADNNLLQVFNAEETGVSRATPSTNFTVMAGPVPIAIAGWGQLGLGYGVRAGGSFGACTPDDPKFGLDVTFAPEFAADAVVQVGVGISGVASLGIRGVINLIRVGFPLTARFEVVKEKIGQVFAPAMKFDAGVGLTLATLAGRVALYIEFLFFEDEWEIFSWPGVGPHRIDLIKLGDVRLPVLGMVG